MKNPKLPKVAVCIPTYDGKNYCWDKFYEQLQNLTYINKVIFIVDNSKTKDNFKRISALGIQCRYINPKGKPIKQILAESHEACRQFAVGIDADFMLHLESDVFNDNPDIIEKMLMRKKMVLNSVYPIRTGADRELNIMLAQDDFHLLHRHLKTFTFQDNLPDFIDGEVKNCFSCGLGLILIHKSVFKRIPFRFYLDNEMLPDFIFAYDMWLLAIINWVDTSLYSRHENKEWFETESGGLVQDKNLIFDK